MNRLEIKYSHQKLAHPSITSLDRYYLHRLETNFLSVEQSLANRQYKISVVF